MTVEEAREEETRIKQMKEKERKRGLDEGSLEKS